MRYSSAPIVLQRKRDRLLATFMFALAFSFTAVTAVFAVECERLITEVSGLKTTTPLSAHELAELEQSTEFAVTLQSQGDIDGCVAAIQKARRIVRIM